MGNKQSFLQKSGYMVISEQENILVKNEGGDLFTIKKMKVNQAGASNFLLQLSPPHIVQHKEIMQDSGLDCEDVYGTTSIFFTACGTIRLGELGVISECDIWSLGCVIYEMCMLKCAFTGRNAIETISKILTSSYEAFPEVFSEDLRQLVKDILQVDPETRPAVAEILTRPFVIKHLYEKSTQTTEDLYKALDMLEELAKGLETVHYNTTVGSLAGGVVGLAGGITSIVGLILAPFTLGASLIVTGVGIGVGVAGGVAAGASNVTKMVNQRSNRQNIKMLIREIQEKITSTSFCIQNIGTAVESQQNEFSKSNKSLSTAHSGVKGEDAEENDWANAGARLGRGLGGIGELVRLTQVVNIGKVAAQTARVVRIAEAATGALAGLFAAVDIFFIALDSKEIHRLRKDYASIEAEQESEMAVTNAESTNTGSNDDTSEQSSTKTDRKEQELRSEIMKFLKKIRETKLDTKNILEELQDELQFLKPNTDDYSRNKSS